MSELLTQMRAGLTARHDSRSTEEVYCHWVRRYVRFHRLRHPAELGDEEISAFLTHLAVTEHVSASTRPRRSARCAHSLCAVRQTDARGPATQISMNDLAADGDRLSKNDTIGLNRGSRWRSLHARRPGGLGRDERSLAHRECPCVSHLPAVALRLSKAPT